MLSCIGVAGAGSAAQKPIVQDLPVRQASTAALPQSNEAMLLSSRAADAIEQGDYRLAIQLIEQVFRLPDALVADPSAPVYYPVWRQARRLIEALPPEGLADYRQIVDPEARARLREASQGGDLTALGALFREYPLSGAAREIGSEYATRLMEAGSFGQAIEVLRDMETAARSAEERFADRARLVACHAMRGDWPPAERLLHEAEEDVEALRTVGAAQRLAALRAWFESRRAASGGASAGAGGARVLSPELRARPRWQQGLFAQTELTRIDVDAEVVEAIDHLRRLPLTTPTVCGGVLLLRQRGQVWAFDALSLTRLWQVPEMRRVEGGAGLPDAPRFGQAIVFEEEDASREPILSPDTRHLLLHALQSGVSAAFGAVYTVEGLTTLSDDELPGRRFGARFFQNVEDLPLANVLVARELASGKLRWRAGAEPADPLYGVAFQDVPLAAGEHLVVPMQREHDLLLCVIDPRSGRTLREVPIVGAPTHFTAAGGRCLLAQDDTTVYVCTGNGVVAAVSSATWEWKWAAPYASTLGKHVASRMMMWRADTGVGEQPPPLAPLVAGELLVTAPVDSDGGEILAFDRYDGRLRWHVPRGDCLWIVGAWGEGLILAGATIQCLELADGRTVRWRSLPLELAGRPALRAGRVYVPTRDALLVLDAATGKVVDDVIHAPDEQGLGNLLASDDALYSVAPARVTRFADLEITRARCAEALERRPGDARAALALAWVRTLERNYQAALEGIESLNTDDPALGAARDELLVRIFVALARESAADRDRLAWLRRAESLSGPPRAAGQLALLIGTALEEAQRWPEVLEHYGRLLLEADSPLVTQPGLLASAWLTAAQRIGHALERVGPAQRDEWIARLVETVSAAPLDAPRAERALEVVQSAAASSPVASAAARRLRRALLLASTRPEMAVRYLREGDDEGLDPEQRRDWLLARWETHVALDLPEQAQRDRAALEALIGPIAVPRPADDPQVPASAAPTSAAALAPELRERIERIDLAQRKLAGDRAAAPPFGSEFNRQWRLGDAAGAQFELLMDGRRPRATCGARILVYDLAQSELHVRTANLGTKLRWTDAATPGAALTPEQAAERDAALRFGEDAEDDAVRSGVWPVSIYEHLAVVPVRGGLVCMGLGPERGGGKRQWAFEVHEPFDVLRDFSDRADGGRYGFYFAPRDDRVLCLGWSDGALRWRRDFGDLAVAQLHAVGDRLLVVGRNNELLVLDGRFGDVLASTPATMITPERVQVVGDTVIALAGRGLTGLAADTLELRWSLGLDSALADWFAVRNRGWLVYREQIADRWVALDARSGRRELRPALPAFERVTAAALTGDRLVVAGTAQSGSGEQPTRLTRVACVNLNDGGLSWLRDDADMAPLNATQLDAHPELIPVLVFTPAAGGSGPGESWERETPPLAIRCIERGSGQLSPTVDIGDNFPRARGVAGAFLVATPTRLIVGVGGALVAYGSSNLGAADAR